MTNFPRIERLPPYVFNITGELKMAARRRGEDIIDMSMGNPDGSTPKHIVDKLVEVVSRPDTHGYSVSKGIPRLRKAISGWYGRRYGVDINPDREEWGRRFGMTAFLNSKGLSREDVVAKIVQMTDGGADYTFDATGNTEVMRTALEACHRGWGTSIIIGVAEAGKEIATRPFQLVTGRNWRGTAFGGAKGRTDVPKIVDMYMTGKIEIDPMITHVMGLEEINKAFDLMHAGESIRSVVVF